MLTASPINQLVQVTFRAMKSASTYTVTIRPRLHSWPRFERAAPCAIGSPGCNLMAIVPGWRVSATFRYSMFLSINNVPLMRLSLCLLNWKNLQGVLSSFHSEVRPASQPRVSLFMLSGSGIQELTISSPILDPKGDDNMNFGFGPSNHDSKAWAIMQTWMKTCSESHEQCKLPRTSPSYRPTRLLRLDSSKTFHLVTGDECPPNVQYVALSYCWGTKPVERLLRLLESTVESLSLEQPIDNLPKTFRDAMSVAQRFGVNYIWIDRLCIFQDSPDDWKREASSMQDIS